MLKQLNLLYFSTTWQTFRKLAFCGLLLGSQDILVNQTVSHQLLGLAPIHPILLAFYWLLLLNAIAGCYDIFLHFRTGTQRRNPELENTGENESTLIQATSQTEG